MGQSLSPADTKDRRGPRVSTICRSSLLGSAWRKKNRSRHTWSILLFKLSSALFYTLFGVMGTDSVLDCGMTYRLAVARTFLKPPRKNGDQHFSARFFTMDTTGKLGRGDKRLLSYSVRLLKTTFMRWLEDKAPQLIASL